MKRRSVISCVLAAGVFDSLVLVTAVFAAIMNVTGGYPVLSAWILVLALALLVVLAVAALADQREEKHSVRKSGQP